MDNKAQFDSIIKRTIGRPVLARRKLKAENARTKGGGKKHNKKQHWWQAGRMNNQRVEVFPGDPAYFN